jgi:hypothetical protein
VQKFFDSVRWDLVGKAVQAHTDADTRWIVLYVIPEGAGTVNPCMKMAPLCQPLVRQVVAPNH